MALVTVLSRAAIKIPVAWIFTSLLFVLGVWLIGEGLWIHTKATLAQWLLQQSWAQTLKTQQPVKPWPWADTWPVGRLIIPEIGIDQIILADASGRSLAFGPGRIGHKIFPKATDSLLLSGHRDTHFSYLKDLGKGSRVTIQGLKGNWRSYEVVETEIVDSRTTKLKHPPETDILMLTTCYPFDALIPGGPLRYIVTARPIVQ